MITRTITKILAAALALAAAAGSHADDSSGPRLMVVDATGKSLPTATVHIMVSNGQGEKDFTTKNYPADRNGVVLIPQQELPQKGGFWAWCADAPGYDGVFQNLIAPGDLSSALTARLNTIKYPRHCNLIGKQGFNLLNPPNAPRELFWNGPSKKVPRPEAISGPASSGHRLK